MGVPKLEYIPHYTYEDYSKWEGRWELIDGVPYAMTPAPNLQHQRISQKIATLLEIALADGEHCYALLPVDWKVSDDTIVQPDNLVLCYEPPKGAYITRAPSLIFEILSKSTAFKDATIKYDIYQREGVKYYCIVDPVDQMIKIYELVEGHYRKQVDVSDDSFRFELKDCEFELSFNLLWKN